MLREGNVSSADGWRELLDPIVRRYAQSGLRKQFRGDAGFARPEIYEYLEEHDFLYAIRLPGNPKPCPIFASPAMLTLARTRKISTIGCSMEISAAGIVILTTTGLRHP